MKIVTPDGDPHGRDNSIVDTRGAVLVDDIHAVALTEPGMGRELYGLELAGRINRSSARSDALYLLDVDGAAAVAAEIVAMFARAGGRRAEEFQSCLDRRLDEQPTRGAGGRR